MTDSRTITVGVLYAGELGAALGALLQARGMRVVTTAAGRSEATAARCAGTIVLDSLAEVLRQSDVVLSVVPPDAAMEVAAAYCETAKQAPAGAIYVDVNSIGPGLAVSIAGMVERVGVSFIDASVNGLAKNLARSGTLFLSGARAGEIARLFDGAMRVRVLGEAAGKASAMKMLLGGLSKGVCALFAELAVLAERREMLGELIEASSEIYPGIWALVERMLPTYAKHAGRRASEMREVDTTARGAGIEPCVIAAIWRMHEAMATIELDRESGEPTVESVIRELMAEKTHSS